MPVSIMIAGGGTGGHLYPGIAVARALLARAPDAQVTFVGTARGLESSVVPRERFALDVIRSAGLKGKSLAELVRGMLLLPVSAWDAWRVISRRAPAVVVGVGGYSSGPVVALAALRGIPTLVMEQNASPGLTNRILARLVRAAAVTFEASLPRFGGKAFVSGNPVRAEFFERVAVESSERPRVLVFGGSQGAHAINMAMVAAAAELVKLSPVPRITHQTGPHDLDQVRDAYAHAGLDARVEPFLFVMHEEMRRADLVVCRAGATTLAELAAAGKPAILIPLPTATDDHQRANATAVASAGAAVLLEQRHLDGASLARELGALTADAAGRERMSRAAAGLARPRAAGDIADRILALAGDVH
jgi:UDP-N-acetylglucosamine--N-acetylmuramyl-(pentapeptide) pyrophosphoryl-undecaprenol N-acetylglucosamine transferase